MSVQALKFIIRLNKEALDGTAVAILFDLAYHCWEEKLTVKRSIDQIAAETGAKRRTVEDALRRLKTKRFLHIESGASKRAVSSYTLLDPTPERVLDGATEAHVPTCTDHTSGRELSTRSNVPKHTSRRVPDRDFRFQKGSSGVGAAANAARFALENDEPEPEESISLPRLSTSPLPIRRLI